MSHKILICSFVALLYYSFGKLGLSLAIPPGYATAIFPPSGMALAAILLYGRYTTIGIWVGAFSMGFPYDPFSVKTLALSFCIASGATLQAFAASIVLNKYREDPIQILGGKGQLRFIIGAAICATFISSSIGVGSLHLLGFVSIEEFLSSWVMWWVGDGIGILIITPILLQISHKLKHVRKKLIFSVTLPVLASSLLVIFFYFKVSHWETTRQKVTFNNEAEVVYNKLDTAIKNSNNLLHFTSSLYSSSNFVSADEFKEFVTKSVEENHSILAIGWSPEIEYSQRKSFEESELDHSSSSPYISERNTDGTYIKATQKEKYYPIVYLLPEQLLEAKLGHDISDTAQIREKISLAKRSNRVEASLSTQFNFKNKDDQEGIYLIMPIDNVKGNQNGILFLFLSIHKLIETTLSIQENEKYHISIASPNDEHKIYSQGLAAGNPEFKFTKTMKSSPNKWNLHIELIPEPPSFNSRWQSWLVLASGLMFTGLLGCLFNSFSTREIQTKSLVEERTLALKKSESEAREINEELLKANKELKNTQFQLIQSAKLASVGQLATGVAHELNQPLNIISMNSDLRLEEFQSGNLSKIEQSYKVIMEQVERATTIINHLKVFGRDSNYLNREPCSINQIISDSFIIINEQLRLRDITIYQDLSEELPLVLCNRIQIEQVLTNLLVNAKDSLEECDTKEILVRSRFYDKSVIINIEDSGKGIDESQIDNIFDPFFTTKSVGKGTGLGLSISYGIIEDHNGLLSVKNKATGGCIFSIKLPIR